MVVGQLAFAGGGVQESAGVEAGRRQLRQPRGQRGRELLAREAGLEAPQQGSPFGQRGLPIARNAAVEVALPAGGGLGNCRSPVGRRSASGTPVAARHTVRSAIVCPVGCPSVDANQAGVRPVVSAWAWTVAANSVTRRARASR